MAKIINVKGRQVFDSRGNPTVEAEVFLDNGISAIAISPSGASTGAFEAHEFRDKDENNFSFPVVLISIGNRAIFNYGTSKKNLKEICLSSGSVVVLRNKSRLYYHSISKVYKSKKNIFYHNKNSSLPKEGRISVTLRRYEEK